MRNVVRIEGPELETWTTAPTTAPAAAPTAAPTTAPAVAPTAAPVTAPAAAPTTAPTPDVEMEDVWDPTDLETLARQAKILTPPRESPTRESTRESPTRESTRESPTRRLPIQAPPCRDNIIVLRLRPGPSPLLDPRILRDRVNRVVQNTALAAIRISPRNNLILTATRGFTADFFLSSVDTWKPVFLEAGFQVETIERPGSWTKLVVYGVPTSQFDLFSEDVFLYNSTRILGTPRWLVRPIEGQKAASVVFSVSPEDTVPRRLFFSGKRLKVAKYEPRGRLLPPT